MLDVWPEVFAYGILLVPKDLRAGERRPVVVCEHGLEGHAREVADPKIDSPYYHHFGANLPTSVLWSMLRRIPLLEASASA